MIKKKSPAKQIPNPERAVAHHEAGHAVAACLVRIPFKTVNIIPDDETLGMCSLVLWKDFQPGIDNSRRTTARAKAYIFVALAGQSAEIKFLRGRILRGVDYQEDFKKAFEMALHLVGNFKVCQAYMDFVSEQTKAIIAYYWIPIQAVAKTLLRQKTLQRREVLHLIRNAWGTDSIPPINLV
jgi:ATP-dependent Zn protease